MKMNTFLTRFSFLAIAATAFFLVACPTSETKEGVPVLNIVIDEDNDSLLAYDTLIIKVYSHDSSFMQEVFHAKLTDPKQLMGIDLDPRVGKQFRVSITGYKGGSIGFNKEFTLISSNKAETKNLPIDTIMVDANLPDIIVNSDTSVAEGDSLRLIISIRNAWTGATLTLKDPVTGVQIDTSAISGGSAHLSWRPGFDRGKNVPYVLTLLYATSDRQIEKKITVRVLNVNRPPKIKAIANQSIKENETLTLKVEASDPDGDSLRFSASNLPTGADFTAGILSWRPQTGQAGNYFIAFKVTDGEAADSLDCVVTVGNVLPPPGRPAVKGKTPTNSRLPAWTWSTGGGGTGIFRYRLNNDDLSNANPTMDTSYAPPTGLAEDIHTLFVQEMNVDSIWSLSGRYSIRVDTTRPPPPVFAAKPNSPTNDPHPTWTWTENSDEGAGRFRFKLNNADLRSGATETQAVSFKPVEREALKEGAHTLYVQQQDSAGNWSLSSSQTIVIDLTPPGPPKITLAQASPTNLVRPKWEIAGSGGGMGLFRVKLNDSVWAQGARLGEFTIYTPDTALNQGVHTLYVQERDSAGNWSATARLGLVLDLTPPPPPVFSELPKSPVNSLTPTWSWSRGGNGGIGTFRVKLDDGKMEEGGTVQNDTSFTPTTGISGPHTLFVQEVDSAGNWSLSTSRTLVLTTTQVLGKPGFSEGTVSTSRIAFDSKGATYYAYVDDNSGRITVMRYNGNSWGYIGPPNIFWGSVYSIAISNDDVPYVAYRDGAVGAKITVMKFKDAAWAPVGKPGISTGAGSDPTLVFSKSNVPYVSFQDGGYQNGIAVARFNEGLSSWEYVGKPGFSNSEAYYSTMTLSSKDIPYVAYADAGNSLKIKVMRLASGNIWENVGAQGISVGGASQITLALDKADMPYLAYSDDLNSPPSGAITVQKFSGNKWEPVGNPELWLGKAQGIQMALNNTGSPYITFTDLDNGSNVSIMRYDGKIWEYVGKPGLASANGVTLKCDGNGIPHIAFADGNNSWRATVLRVAFDP